MPCGNEWITGLAEMIVARITGILGLILMLVACSGESGAERRLLGPAKDCDAAVTSCQISEGNISVALTMGPNVKPLQPFTLSLLIDGGKVTPQSVVADFQMQGMDMETICKILEVSESNGRVLLHRARSTIREAINAHYGESKYSK